MSAGLELLSLLAAAIAGAGCDVATDQLPRAGECPPLELVSLTPADNEEGVSPNVTVVYTFTDFPEPDTAINSNFGIFSGPYYYTAFESVDLIGRKIKFKPTGALPRGIGFTLGLSTRVTSLRGCPLMPPAALPSGKRQESYYFTFRTAEPNVDVPPADAAPPPATFPEVLAVMAAHCAGCHLPGPDGASAGTCLKAPAGGVSLCARQAYASIVGVTSRQVSRLAIVAPRDSSRSYLLRKLLGAPPTTGHRAPPGDALTDAELAVIQSWIDAGASSS